jgi:hypothetical protein
VPLLQPPQDAEKTEATFRIRTAAQTPSTQHEKTGVSPLSKIDRVSCAICIEN